MSTGQNYRGLDIAQRVEISCGAGFQPAAVAPSRTVTEIAITERIYIHPMF